MPPLLFISYDYDHDAHYKRLLKAWAGNHRFAVAFHDHSVDVAINSLDAAPIRRAISRRLNESDALLCIVGEYTWESHWVAWEIEKAHQLGLPLIGVKLDRRYVSPPALLRKDVHWAYRFTAENIEAMLWRVS